MINLTNNPVFAMIGMAGCGRIADQAAAFSAASQQ